MKQLLGFTVLMLVTGAVYAQKPTDLAPKDSPALQTLIQLSIDKAADQKAFDIKLQQARSSLDQAQKALNDQLQSEQKDLNGKLQADKKYKPLLDQIADTQKKVNEAGQAAQATFTKDAGPIQQKVATEAAQIEGLIPVVRKENGFPDNAAFDVATQKWSEAPAVPAMKAPDKR